MKKFAGKIAFITGGASGAGLGQAKLFSKAGMKVVIADVRQDALNAAVKEIMAYSGCSDEDVFPIKLDLTDREAYARAADLVEEIYEGPPHLLIQTAGVNSFGPAEASTFEDYDWVMGVCLNAVVNGLVIFVPRMIKAYAGKEEFHVAATASYGAFMGGATTAPYSAAKAAVLNLYDSYYQALSPYGGGATVICPANINSNIGEAEKYRPEHLKNSGYNVTDKTINLLKSIHATGMDPVELAEWLKRGIENDQVIVVPYENGPQMMQANYDTYIKYATPEGMKEIKAAEAEKRKQTEEYAKNNGGGDDTGFAKAKADIDWVRPENKV